MNRIRSTTLRRPTRATRRVPRSRTEAAVALVRTEFERARLERELDQIDQRRGAAQEARDLAEQAADRLLDRLTGPEDKE